MIWPGFVVLGFAVVLKTACSPVAPTPTADPTPILPELVFHGASRSQERLGWELWEEQKGCAGYDGSLTREFPVYVQPRTVWCWGMVAAGCTTPTQISVGTPWYENALSHEYLHHILERTEEIDVDHRHPIWVQCDGRNR